MDDHSVAATTKRHKVLKEGRMTNLLLRSTLDRIDPLRVVDPATTSRKRQLKDAKRERVLQN